jgi:hypothetical protein
MFPDCGAECFVRFFAHRGHSPFVVTYLLNFTYDERGTRGTGKRAHPLTAAETFTVLEAIRDVCAIRKWELIAAHVRSTNAHAILECFAAPARIVAEWKTCAADRLNKETGRCVRWASGGEVTRLASAAEVQAALRYVIGNQDRTMALFVGERSSAPEVRHGDSRHELRKTKRPLAFAKGLIKTPSKSLAAMSSEG